MKYISSLLALILCYTLAVNGQNPTVALSNEFEQPGDGWDKLLQLKNGNTCYLHFSRTTGLEVRMYDRKRVQTSMDTVHSQLWNSSDLENTEIDAIYQINGQPVIFLQQLVKDIPEVFRLVLDENTGKLLKEDKLGELPSVRNRTMFAQNNEASHDCYVEKDQRSDYYAVALFSGTEIQPGENEQRRIFVYHFSPEHQLINTGYFYMQDATFSYFSYIHMAVDGERKVYMATTGFNGKRKSGNAQSKVVFSMLCRDSTAFAHNVIPYSFNYNQVSGLVKVVPAFKEIRLLLHVPSERGSSNSGTLMNIFTEDGKLRKHPVLSYPELSRNVEMNLNYKDNYNGIPQNWIMNNDGSSTLMLENLSYFKQGNNQIMNLHTNMGDAGVAELDTLGKEDATWSLGKYQVITGTCQPFFQHRRSKSEWSFRNKIAALNLSTYVSYDFVNFPDLTFVLFNDYLQYLDTGGGDKTKKPLKFADDANFVCYRYYNKKIERMYLFGQPEVSKRYACMLGASDYNERSRVYATVMLSRIGTNKKAAIAWIQF
ncbi:hypothetical protein CLV59_106314 [Chitinophaga dinghuensis]|uniref:Uncharacterized protein n=1 Tax=Chitinophaga dinghuensis TaxID=1539050 RepID=A0A327VVD9_9BACT|nr:hypothetical protein [Chitinophaga dinghuensis]RAJ79253.1 hypothetical protein CLV59_106314 [Chitinophaga dinghuensis]